MGAWRKHGEATCYLLGKRTVRAIRVPLQLLFNAQFHAWAAVMLHHQHQCHTFSAHPAPSPRLPCAATNARYCNTATGRR